LSSLGFGNRASDARAYLSGGVPSTNIMIIDELSVIQVWRDIESRKQRTSQCCKCDCCEICDPRDLNCMELLLSSWRRKSMIKDDRLAYETTVTLASDDGVDNGMRLTGFESEKLLTNQSSNCASYQATDDVVHYKSQQFSLPKSFQSYDDPLFLSYIRDIVLGSDHMP
jgi:hypothetical protein